MYWRCGWDVTSYEDAACCALDLASEGRSSYVLCEDCVTNSHTMIESKFLKRLYEVPPVGTWKFYAMTLNISGR